MRLCLLLVPVVLLCLLTACNDNGDSTVSSNNPIVDEIPGDSTASSNNPIAAETQCIAQSPWLAYGEGLHASAVSSVPAPASDSVVKSIAQCNGNTAFQFGAAKTDITVS
jgi:hypothetical protein